MKKLLILIAIISLLSFTDTNPLIGRWENISHTGAVTTVFFKNDSVFEAFVNKKPFASGIYKFNERDSSFSFVDNGCNGARGLYKLRLYSNADSIKLTAISDTCTRRKDGMEKLALRRVKSPGA